MKPICSHTFNHTYYVSSFSKEGEFPQKVRLNNGQEIKWNDLEYDKDGIYQKMGLSTESQVSGSTGSVNPKEYVTYTLNIYEAAILPVEVEYQYYDSYHEQLPKKEFRTIIIKGKESS